MAAAKDRKKKYKGYDKLVFNVVSHVTLFVLAAACLLPFWLVISGSVSDQQSIWLNGYQLIPTHFPWMHIKCCFGFHRNCYVHMG